MRFGALRTSSASRIVSALACALLAGFCAGAAAATPATAQSIGSLGPIPLPVNLPAKLIPQFTPDGSVVPGTLDQRSGTTGTQDYDRGLYVHYCPGEPSRPRAVASHTSWAGWPPKECLKMDKGQSGSSHLLVGLDAVHNWLLGGYGNDTIIGGNAGDVIWADYHPSGEQFQIASIHAGNGRNVIYANDTRDYVWTGTNPATVVHAHGPGTSGVIHCQSPRIVVYMSSISQRHFKLDGCRRISHFSVGY